MRNKGLKIIGLVLCSVGLGAGVLVAQAGSVVPVETSRVFVPSGFDDNDNVEVVLDGYLPSGCYKLLRPEVTIDAATRKVFVTPMARYFDVPCIEARVPYTYEVQLGALPQGQFDVVTNAGALTEKLTITEAANAGPDDFLYAPIDSVQVSKRHAGSRANVAILEGRFTNSCMQFKEVKIINSGATLEVLPVIELAERDGCTAMEFPFRKLVDLPEGIAPGRHLLHVRSLNGQAVNLVFSVGSDR